VQIKSVKIVLSILLFGSVFQLQAQDRIPFEQAKKYILAGVNVNGKISYNQQTVVTFSGMEKGQEEFQFLEKKSVMPLKNLANWAFLVTLISM